MAYALRAALRASEIVGGMGVITHPLDETVRGFYAGWGSRICRSIGAAR